MITAQDAATIGVLIFLEGLLSMDNALVLAVIARGVKPELQKKVLLYGLVGAVFFRMLAILFATWLIQYTWIKFAGGLYLLWLAFKYFFMTEKETHAEVVARGFWSTVLVVELTDIAFAVDSILAAIALSNKYWVVVTGGLIGTFLMRFAAQQFISLLYKFPKLESTAYILISIIGVKVIVEGLHLPGVDFHSYQSPWFWVQWTLIAVVLALGFRKNQSE